MVHKNGLNTYGTSKALDHTVHLQSQIRVFTVGIHQNRFLWLKDRISFPIKEPQICFISCHTSAVKYLFSSKTTAKIYISLNKTGLYFGIVLEGKVLVL